MGNFIDLNSPCDGCEKSFIKYSYDGTPLPVSKDYKHIEINVTDQTSDLWVVDIIPEVSCGTEVVVRKLNNTPFIIKYNDNGEIYEFIDKRLEFITLEWNGVEYWVK